jgi:hypothetical protein
MEFLNSSNLEVLSKGNEPTFCTAVRREVIDINLGTYELLDSITVWEVSLEPSLSDHRNIPFTLRGNNWFSFREVLRERLERGPAMDMKDEASLGLAIQWIQQALILAYENNCPL